MEEGWGVGESGVSHETPPDFKIDTVWFLICIGCMHIKPPHLSKVVKSVGRYIDLAWLMNGKSKRQPFLG